MKERIRKLRRALDLTQQEFADKIGMKRNTIANYETGRNDPSASVISLICREFNANEDWLRTGEGEMFVQRTRNQVITDFLGKMIIEDATFKKQFIETLAELDDMDWAVLEKLANKLASKKD
ncbi:helix-turn-helix transcriptional regulator [[Clostridium] symbiosum]|uniref:helix-turn-helix domain-containing protein n=1 Tax=Clostridium symbiosum TaxID=1512 RepID=UPI00157000E2|nr:helix-turn-helix transcriptional regulator [[Clostridium] symbiosum]